MANFSEQLLKYYKEKVKLSPAMQDEMRKKWQIQERIIDGKLRINYDYKYIKQGSYDMKTMIQYPKNGFDIDYGIAFRNIGYISHGKLRQIVFDCVQSQHFNKAPKLGTNCITIYCDVGYTIDIPVYKEENGTLLLAQSTGWKESDPKRISDWFRRTEKQTPQLDDGYQFRMIVCLLKKWCTSREHWNLPCGLVLSALASECYRANVRHDLVFINTLKAIRDRLRWNKVVLNPIDSSEEFTYSDTRKRQLNKLYEQISEFSDKLTLLDSYYPMASSDWNRFFGTDFFR